MPQVEFEEMYGMTLAEARNPHARPITALVDELERSWSAIELDRLCRPGGQPVEVVLGAALEGGSLEDFASAVVFGCDHLPYRHLPQRAAEIASLERLLALGIGVDTPRLRHATQLRVAAPGQASGVELVHRDGWAEPFVLRSSFHWSRRALELVWASRKRHTGWDPSLMSEVLREAACRYDYALPVRYDDGMPMHGPLPSLAPMELDVAEAGADSPGAVDRSILLELGRAVGQGPPSLELDDCVYVETERFAARVCQREHARGAMDARARVSVSRIADPRARDAYNGKVLTNWRDGEYTRYGGPVYPYGYYVLTATHALEVHVEPRAFA